MTTSSRFQFINLNSNPHIEIKSHELQRIIRSTAVYNAKNLLIKERHQSGEAPQAGKSGGRKARKSLSRQSSDSNATSTKALEGIQSTLLSKVNPVNLDLENDTLDPFETFAVKDVSPLEVGRAASCEAPSLTSFLGELCIILSIELLKASE